MDERASLLSSLPSSNSSYESTRLSSVAPAHPVSLSWHNLSVRMAKPPQRLLLNRVSGYASTGQLVALMGASGAGKTTLLNTVMGRNLRGLDVDGEVRVNGVVLGHEISTICGYAQQDDLFMSTLTVREHLELQARLRLSVNDDQRRRRVEQVIEELGLSRCQRTRIGNAAMRKGISGGEAKRLTFAAELLTNPALFFCDEPTTGLDSFMAESVVRVLSRLAHSGRTVICTIHQPSSQLYSMFDRALLLAGGRTAFLGAPLDAVKMLADCGFPCPDNYNPADMIIHALSMVPNEEEQCKQRITAICDHFARSNLGRALEQEITTIVDEPRTLPTPRRRAGRTTQLCVLLRRSLLDNWRNPSLARAKFLQKLFMGLFIGFLYLQMPLSQIGVQNLNGALYYIVAELTYSTMFGILNFMPSDFPLVVREYHDGLYSVACYYIARSLSYMPLFTLDGVLLLLVCYWMVGFASGLSHILFALITCVLIEQSAAAFGVMLSTIAPSYPVAVSVAGPVLTLLSLTGGLYANVGALPGYIAWVQYLSWFRYGFEALTINQWRDVSHLVCSSNATSRCLASGDAVLASLSFSRSHLLEDLLLMFMFIIVYYLFGYAGLWMRIRRAR